MSRLHYKAEFLNFSGQEVFYKYCPDTVYQKEIRGEFKFNLENWQPIITLRAESKGEDVFYIDENCVRSLTGKIKKHFEQYNEFPNEILYIA